jgi:hypothetical protein
MQIGRLVTRDPPILPMILGSRDGSGMAGTGYLFVPNVNGNSTIVPERHQIGGRRDLELVRLHLPAERPA